MAVKISLSYVKNSSSTTNRTTNVTVTLKCSWTYGSWNHLSPSGSVKINGTTYSFKKSFNPNRTNSGSMTLWSKSVNIKHSSNGKATLTCSATYHTDVSSGTVKTSFSKTLPSIAATSVTKPTSTNSKKVKITRLDYQNNSSMLFATWDWSKDHTDYYDVRWYYGTGNGVWFNGSDTDEKSRQSTYSPPSNATSIRVKIKPVSTKYKKKSGNTEKEVSYWTADWAYKDYNLKDGPPTTPAVPSAKIEDLKLTVESDNLNVNASQIKYEVVQDDIKVYKTATVSITMSAANYSTTVASGHSYKVRAQSVRGGEKSTWSDYTSEMYTQPGKPSGFKTIKPTSSTSVKLTWDAVPTADSYTIEYTTDKTHFDGSDDVSSQSTDGTTFEFTRLTTGVEYFFRLIASNDSGSSEPSDISSIAIGKAPAAPTTWSSTNTAIIGEPMTLYWVHNAEDGSDETYAQIEIIYDGSTPTPITLINPNAGNDDVEDTTRYLIVHTTNNPDETLPEGTPDNEILLYVPEGVEIEWRVRTAGITKEFGDWSVKRTIDIYAKPTLTIEITNENGDNLIDNITNIVEITKFPFYIRGFTGPATQSPIGYYLSVIANRAYEYVDDIGNVRLISEGDEVYSEYFDTNKELVVEMLPNIIDLEGEIPYTLIATASMNSGLTAEALLEFTVSWEDVAYTPDADIIIDEKAITAKIRPFCEYEEYIYYKVTHNPDTGVWTNTGEETKIVQEDGFIENAYTEDDRLVYYGLDENGSNVYFVVGDDVNTVIVEGITLSVYRREFDGGFTEIASGITNSNTWVIDPHPALDYARYRIVAIEDATGAVGFYDRPNEPVGITDVIIQWDEDWVYFDASDNPNDDPEDSQWSGSLLRLPYNIDISNNHSNDVALVEYIGRKRPVTYYGTQLGESATWNVEVPKEDTETIYALRRLAVWLGDVYVREPHGSGYWANVSVSFSQKHLDLTVPVTLNITRVEGGV